MINKSIKSNSSINLFHLSLFSGRMSELLATIEGVFVNSSKTAYIVTPNPEQIVQSRQDNQFLRDLQAADLRLPDGIGLVVASRLLANKNKGAVITERIAGRDVVVSLLKLAHAQDLTVMVIGGKEYGTKNDRPQQLQLEGKVFWIRGYQDVFHPLSQEENNVKEALQTIQPQLVFVAFGAPAQERWMMDHRQLLEKNNVKLAMVVGGTFDQLLGLVPQCPNWLAQIGGEWFFRLLMQPWRWRRQMRLLEFIGMTIKETLS